MRASPMLVGAALIACATPAHAVTDCVDLWSTAYAVTNQLQSCNDPSGLLGLTVNELRDHLYDSPLDVEWSCANDQPGGNETVEQCGPVPEKPLVGHPVPKCADGTESCSEEEQIRCVDGTRPMFYVDPADTPSDRWLFFFQGGESCSRGYEVKTDAAPVPGGERCGSAYFADPSMMSSFPVRQAPLAFGAPAVSRTDYGVYSDGAMYGGSEFNDVNRVFFDKCSFDRYQGDVTVGDGTADPDTGGRPEFDGHSFELYFHGQRIVEAVTNLLNTTAGASMGLPLLGEAETVIFAAHSGGAHGLAQNLDRFAGWMQAGDTWNVESVVGVFDARNTPGIERHRAAPSESMYDYVAEPLDCDPALYSCLARGENNAGRGFSDEWFETVQQVPLEYWHAPLDESCLASTHGAASTLRKCTDTPHVIYNHLETPFFLRQSQVDNHQTDDNPPHADDPRYNPRANNFRAEMVAQAEDFHVGAAASACESTGYAWVATHAGGFFPCDTAHVGIVDDNSFFVETISGWSYYDTLVRWLADPNTESWLVETCP